MILNPTYYSKNYAGIILLSSPTQEAGVQHQSFLPYIEIVP